VTPHNCVKTFTDIDTMHRRRFLKTLPTGVAAASSLAAASFAAPPALRVNTVLGERSPRALGMTLMHEHVLVDFVGADKVSPTRYNTEEVFHTALPHLKALRAAGCRTLVECTPAFLGRDVTLLKRLASASGLHIVTNTGFYGAANDKYVPSIARQETAEQLAARWIREFQEGIDGTGIRPGIIKIGVDPGPLSEIDAKLVRAAAKTHLQTGLTIASHTGDGVAALEELEILKQEGAHPGAFVWVHAQTEGNGSLHLKAAQQGAWVEFDGISEGSAEKHLQLVKGMMDQGFAERVLISQDAGWYHVGEPKGGTFRPYTFVFANFVPSLRRAGISPAQMRSLLIDNPRKALALEIRKLARTSS
jgi:predicted metal-dependent phosphotriesterase family hydrolase